MTRPTPLLAVDALCVNFGPSRVVDDVSFDVAAGEKFGLVGESGSGKSVTALSILRLLEAASYEGEIRFEGDDVLRKSPRDLQAMRGRDIAMIFQEPMTALNSLYTIGNQIGEVLELHEGLATRQARGRAIELLARTGIPDPDTKIDAYPHQLSGGQRQRAMIAMALACRPKLLIADEPTTALDVTIQAQIVDLLLRLKRETGMGLVLVTHDLGLVAEAADRVAVQYAGRQVEMQDVGPLFDDPHHPYTQALLAALPDRAALSAQAKPGLAPAGARPRLRLSAIPGVVPGQSDHLPGCAFAPRCAFAFDRCHSEAPAQASAALGHARCHAPLQHGQALRPEAAT